MKSSSLVSIGALEHILLETSPHAAVQQAVDIIAGMIPSCSVTVMSVSPDRTVRFGAANGISWTVLHRAERSFNTSLPRNLREIIRDRRMCLIEDVPDYPDWRRPAGDIVSYVGFPIIVDRRVAGIVNVQTARRALRQADVDAVSPLVRLIALIVGRYLKEQQSTQRENFLGLLHEVTVDGIRATTATEYMNAVIRRIVHRLRYQYVAIFLYDDAEDALILRAQKGYSEDYDNLALPVHGHNGVVVRAFRTRRSVYVPDADKSPFYIHGLLGGQSDLALPLVAAGKVIGVLNLESKRKNSFAREDVRNLMPLASNVALLLASMHMKQLLREQALLDGLTGAHNRHAMADIVAEEMERARRHDRDVSFVMLDIDEFKVVNDRLGHAEGDRILQELTALLRQSLRTGDRIIRYGGDEFLLVLPETSQREIELLLERLRSMIELRITTMLGPLHISTGMATFRGDPLAGDLVQLADRRMYEEKARHRALLAEDDNL